MNFRHGALLSSWCIRVLYTRQINLTCLIFEEVVDYSIL